MPDIKLRDKAQLGASEEPGPQWTRACKPWGGGAETVQSCSGGKDKAEQDTVTWADHV